MNDVMKAVKDSEAEVKDRAFDNACAMTLEIRQGLADALRKTLADIPGVSLL